MKVSPTQTRSHSRFHQASRVKGLLRGPYGTSDVSRRGRSQVRKVQDDELLNATLGGGNKMF